MISEAEFRAATDAAERERRDGLLATAVQYEASSHAFALELTNGETLRVPVRSLPGLECATAAQLATATLDLAGAGLHIAELDADYSVPGLVSVMRGRS